MRWLTLISLPLFAAACGERREPSSAPIVHLTPALTTESVAHDPDDPSVWIDPDDPSRSLLICTDKVEKNGGLFVFDLKGKVIQTISPLDRPNNVDVEQGVELGGRTLDIAVTTERKTHSIRIYSIDPRTRTLSEIAKLPVFEGETGELHEPMGVAIYKRAPDAVFVIVGRKSGPKEGYLWEYRLVTGPELTLVRKFGTYSGSGEIEAIAVDDELGYVYYADENAGLRKYLADPDLPGAARELAFFGQTGYMGNREGLAVYSRGRGRGYIVSTDQIPSQSRYILYRREGSSSDPHNHSEVVAVLQGSADSTDGIEVLPVSPGAGSPRGLLVAMNSAQKNFILFSWPAIFE